MGRGGQMEVNISALSHSYGQREALCDITLALRPGLTTLLGPNGAGKSTLFALITGLQKVVLGNIYFNGKALASNRTQVLSKMGVVFQQNTLDVDLSVQQNLAYFAALHGISIKDALKQVGELLDQLELTQCLHTKIRDLNGGHRRRVELVRCLIHRPSLLLLDEPTVGLDIASRQLIFDVVQDLADKSGITVLWATHLFEEVKPQNQLIVLSKGCVIADGRCQDLLTLHNQPDIEHLWQIFMHTQQRVK